MDIDKVPEQVWMDLVTDRKQCQLEFLAANVLLARLKLKTKQNPGSARDCAAELRDLFKSAIHIPKVGKDLHTIMNGRSV